MQVLVNMLSRNHNHTATVKMEMPCLRRSMIQTYWQLGFRYLILYVSLYISIANSHAGLKTCVVTNNWIDDIFSVSLAFPSEMFDCILESSKLRMRKPDPEIYRLACVRLGVSPHEVSSRLWPLSLSECSMSPLSFVCMYTIPHVHVHSLVRPYIYLRPL